MKILVTGGAGYIGSHTCLELLNAGYEVVVLDNLYNSCEESLKRVEKLTGKKMSFYEVDLLDAAGMEKLFEAEKPEAVIHFAGLKAVGESCKVPLRYFTNNVSGTINLLNVMEKFNVKKLVFSSSATVYGVQESPAYTEEMTTSSTAVSSPYGRTKLMIEDMLKDICAADPSWNVALLRYFNPIGAHESGEIGEDPQGIPNNLVPYVAKVAIGELEHINVFGTDYETPDGTCIRDYLHVVDLAIGHEKAIVKLNEEPGLVIYNLGTGKGCSVLEVINSFEAACGKELPKVMAPRRAGDLPEYFSVPTKAEKELGWKAERGIKEMCEDTWRWQSKNPGGYRI